YALRAAHYFVTNEGTRANRESEWAAKLDPESPAIAGTRAVILLAFGQGEGAVSAARRAVELSGEAARFLTQLCLVRLGAERVEESLEPCKKAADKEPGSVGTQVALAFAYLAQGEPEKAKEHVDKADKVDDADPSVHKAR